MTEPKRTAEWLRYTFVLLAGLIIGFALLFTTFKALTPLAARYQNYFEEYLSDQYGIEVHIERMQTGWYLWHPVLQLNGVNFVTPEPIKVKQLILGLDILNSIFHRQWRLGLLSIKGIKLQASVDAMALTATDVNVFDELTQIIKEKLSPSTINFLLSLHKIILQDIDLTIIKPDGSQLYFYPVKIVVWHEGNHYRWKTYASTQLDHNPTTLALVGDLILNSVDVNKLSGTLYFSIQNGSLDLFKPWFINFPKYLHQGSGDLAVWLKLSKGTINQMDTAFLLNNIELQQFNPIKIQRLYGSLNWLRTNTGWSISTDKLNLELNRQNWPLNQLKIDYDKEKQTYQLYIKWLLLSILKFDIPWIKTSSLGHLFSSDGRLEDAHVIFSLPKLDGSICLANINSAFVFPKSNNQSASLKDITPLYFLTRFHDLTLNSTKYRPGIHGLDGVLYWEPSAGRLELDSNNATIEFRKNKNCIQQSTSRPHDSFAGLSAGSSLDAADNPQHVGQLPSCPRINAVINGALEWQLLSSGWRYTLERITLMNDDILLSGQGSFDDPEHPDLTFINLELDYAIKNTEKLKFLLKPLNLKQGLKHWLLHGIKKIAMATGSARINGKWNDFPFDKQRGTFTVETELKGTELFFAAGWPLVRDIVALITVKNRNLNAHILEANMNGVTVNNVPISVSDIGHDKEVLKAYGELEASGRQLLNYVLHSPLQKHLGKLKLLEINNNLNLALALQILLYTKENDVACQGKIDFADNKAVLKPGFLNFALNHLKGIIYFNQYGLVNSRLKGEFADAPIEVGFTSYPAPNPRLEVVLDGASSIDWLEKKFHFILTPFIKGNFKFKGLLTLTDNTEDLDQLTLASSLSGVRVDLPDPMGKSVEKIRPLNLEIQFNPASAINISFVYGKILNGVLMYQKEQDVWQMSKGSINLGMGKPQAISGISGIQLTGSWPSFDVASWQSVLDRLKKYSKNTANNVISVLNVHFDSLNLWNQNFSNVGLQMTMNSDASVVMHINQSDFNASMVYHPKENLLAGTAHHISIANLSTANSRTTSIKPSQIPNLDLTIEDLWINQKPIGTVNFSSHTRLNQFIIDKGNIQTPDYHVDFSGIWDAAVNNAKTNVKLNIYINDLGKTLARLKFNPVISSGKGNITFAGNWKGSPLDYKVSQLNGSMELAIKNGRITQLSKEAEEKLGIGKLLSIFSLQTIPRRLTLDFSDLSHNGYSFDSFNGNFSLAAGNMNTSKTVMDGPVAKVEMKGSLDLAREWYDLDLQVFPHVSASLPVAATIAINPVIGIAAFMASNILTQSVLVSSYSYRVSGPWSSPVVQEVKVNKKH